MRQGAISPVVTALALTGLAATGAPAAGERTAAPSEDAPAFTDVTRAAGIRHRHARPRVDARLENIMPWMSAIGAAGAAADYDRDGDTDLYVTSSRKGTPNYLYPNTGILTFRERARAAGVAHLNGADGVSIDAAFGDLDNDGFPDLYVAKWGTNQLFRNRGDGTFVDVTEASGLGDAGNAACVTFLDYNLDGYLDILVGNYFPPVNLWKVSETRIMHDSFEEARNAGANVLYRNNGDGTFTDISRDLNVDDTGWTLDIGCADIDNDGDQDCYLANDFGADKLFRNNGNGTFTDVSQRSIGLDTRKGMNVDFGDFDNDGALDIYVTNITTRDYLQEGNMLHRNLGNGVFLDIAAEVGAWYGGWGWAGKFVDFDNDGDLDIYTVNGFVSAGHRGAWLAHRSDAVSREERQCLKECLAREDYWCALASMATTPGLDIRDARNWPPMNIRADPTPITSWCYQPLPESILTECARFVPRRRGPIETDAFCARLLAVYDREDDPQALWGRRRRYKNFSGYEASRLFRNYGGQTFTEIAAAAGVADRRDGRGIVVADLDNDGDLDLFVTNQDAAPVLFRNDAGGRNHWIAFELQGTRSTADAVGARVRIRTGDRIQVREVDGGNGYSSQSSRRLSFGLGETSRVDTVEVRWPSGLTRTWRDVQADQLLTVIEEGKNE